MQDGKSYLSRVRGVELLPGEQVRAILDANAGLVGEPPPAGAALIATNARLIRTAAEPQGPATEMFAMDTVSAARVADERRRGLSWGQWIMLAAVGAAIYLALGYWLANRLPGPMIPVINMNPAALGLLVLILFVGGWIWRGTARSAVRKIQITGTSWAMETPGKAPTADLIEFSTTLMALRQKAADGIGSDRFHIDGVRAGANPSEPGGG